MNPRVVPAEAIDDGHVRVRLSNGERAIFDARPFMSFPALIQLRDAAFFR